METLELLAHVLEYPDALTLDSARAAARRVEGDAPELAAALAALGNYLAAAPAGEAEERYTPLFDLNPVCTLHLGYHLFGETYQRGAFLAGMSGELKRWSLETRGGELADHVSNALRLLARVEGEDDRVTFVDQALLPALTRMSVALGDSSSPWASVIRALPELVGPLGSGEPAVLLLPTSPTQEVSLDA